MLSRGWHPIPPGLPKDALNRIPTKQGPTFDDTDRVDTTWTEAWCLCLWDRLCHVGKGHMRLYAMELPRYRSNPRLRRAILIAAKIASSKTNTLVIAIDRALVVLDEKYGHELQQNVSPETSES